jgi:hypothetical protein
MQSKEDDPKPQSGSSSLFFLPNFQKIVVKVDLSIQILKESITLFAFFVELKEKKQSRWLFQSQICRIWAS